MSLNGQYRLQNIYPGNTKPFIGTVTQGPMMPVVGIAPEVIAKSEIWDVRHVGPDPTGSRYALSIGGLMPRIVDEGGKDLLFIGNEGLYCDSWVVEQVPNEENVYTIGNPGDNAKRWTLGGVGGDQVSIEVLPMDGEYPLISPLQQWKFEPING